MRWTKLDDSKHFFVIIKRNVFIYDIVHRISEFETEMNLSEDERWTKGTSLKCNAFNYVYELIQRLGKLEDDVLRFRQRKSIHDKIQEARNKACGQ